jgi:Mor family transcriptional regulator
VIRIDIEELEDVELCGVYKDIEEYFGLDIAYEMYNHYKGLQITFPVRFLSKEYVVKRINIENDGKNTQELALKYGYSERWIRKNLTRKG